ncbi:Outer membrane efflux protein [Symmachiella macrocystis]|uniref:Outer membrane efflux protein n=2 Tax=Symmachiella macrocystis TaxID=2527985 RepID=A0A5C6BJB4_9PLAN|nr:Outer membrane efflux protein [Symmachiella macrocystis]
MHCCMNMPIAGLRASLIAGSVIAVMGCSVTTNQPPVDLKRLAGNAAQTSTITVKQSEAESNDQIETKLSDPLQLVSNEDEATTDLEDLPEAAEFLTDEDSAAEPEERAIEDYLQPIPLDLASGNASAVVIDQVVNSVHESYPLLAAALLENSIADGKQLATWGAFDTKFKSASQNGALGFYETYRQDIGFVQPIYNGGEFFSGYRIGRGNFQPWYLERQTNEGGEFKAGFRVPLLKNREIDERRAALWRATYEQQRVRPEVRAQLILFVREASIAYWTWIATGQQYRIWQQALELSEERNSRLQRRVEEGDLDPPALQDNLRSIALRESKLIDRGRKLQQSAVKLSLFYRSADGSPIIPEPSQLRDFPEPTEFLASQIESDIQVALSQRPELAALDALYRQINVDLAEANNEYLPTVDAQVWNSQDVGEPTSSKRDKSRYELEASLFIDVPLQRRKARGKSHAAEAKLSQVAVKRRFTQDKIVAEVQAAFAGLTAAYDRLGKAREAKRLAEYMADVERRRFELGQSGLLDVFIREQSAIEAADGEVEALLEYFAALANYTAALAFDWPMPAESKP